MWITEDNQLRWSTPKPSPYFDFDYEKKDWVLNEEKFKEVQTKKQNEVWEKIKERRSLANSKGAYVESVKKHFHTDIEAQVNYSNLQRAIDMGYFEEVKWKTVEGDFVIMTIGLFKEVSKSIFKTGQQNFEVAEVHRAKMQLVDDPYQYDYSTGWSDLENSYEKPIKDLPTEEEKNAESGSNLTYDNSAYTVSSE